jgi:hypothetical protein
MSDNNFYIYKTDSDQISINRFGESGALMLSGLDELQINSNFNIKNLQSNLVNIDFNDQLVLIGNNKFYFAFAKSGEGAKSYFYQLESGKSLDLSLGNQFDNGNSIVEDFFDLSYRTGNLNLNVGVNISGNLKVSGTGTFNAIDLNNIDNISLSGVDVAITSGSVTVNNTNVALSNQIFSTFPPGTGVRRYRPDGTLTLSTVTPASGFIGYFPFIIKELAINPIIFVEVSTVVNPTPIRYGIYSGISGFEGARLFNSGSINCPSVLGVYSSNISVNLPEGPYIIATSNTGVASPHSFRASAGNMNQSMFGEPIGNTLFGPSSSHYYETGSDLRTIIGTGLIATTSPSPIPYISY